MIIKYVIDYLSPCYPRITGFSQAVVEVFRRTSLRYKGTIIRAHGPPDTWGDGVWEAYVRGLYSIHAESKEVFLSKLPKEVKELTIQEDRSQHLPMLYAAETFFARVPTWRQEEVTMETRRSVYGMAFGPDRRH